MNSVHYSKNVCSELYVMLKQLIKCLVLIELSVTKVVLLVTTFLSFQITQDL